MPPMYMVNAGLKCRYLMGAFVKLYIGTEFAHDESDAWLMSEADYDKWAGSHVMNQLERWKHDNVLKYKAYDIIADYKDLEKRFSTQLSGLLLVQNDSVIRTNQLSSAMMKEIPTVLEQLKELQGEKDNGD